MKRGDVWFRASDGDVRTVPFAEVKECAGYLFVYERVEVPGISYDNHDDDADIAATVPPEEVVLPVEVLNVLPLEEPIPVRPCAYHVSIPDIALNEPLFPNDYWHSGTKLLTNFVNFVFGA